jgi:hypothetical protein
LIDQPSANTQTLSFSGNAMAGVSGTIYAAGAALSESGNAQLNSALDVNTLNISGNGIANIVVAGGTGAAASAEFGTTPTMTLPGFDSIPNPAPSNVTYPTARVAGSNVAGAPTGDTGAMAAAGSLPQVNMASQVFGADEPDNVSQTVALVTAIGQADSTPVQTAAEDTLILADQSFPSAETGIAIPAETWDLDVVAARGFSRARSPHDSLLGDLAMLWIKAADRTNEPELIVSASLVREVTKMHDRRVVLRDESTNVDVKPIVVPARPRQSERGMPGVAAVAILAGFNGFARKLRAPRSLKARGVAPRSPKHRDS